MFRMFRNAVAALSALWLFLAPALCSAGVLTHACDCSSGLSECGTCCGGEKPGCDCAEEGCSHDACANDPCQVAIGAEKVSSAELDFAAEPAFAAFDPLLARHSALLQPGLAATSDLSGARKNLPYHLSDIPLLV